jgi:rhodanese-related sulfurtransferase
MNTIQPNQLHELRQAGKFLHLVDVRTPAEHAEIHVPGVRLEPLDRLSPATFEQAGVAKDQPVYLLCRSGARARQAAEKLEKAGYTQCSVVEGGTEAWAKAGLPVNRGTTKVLSLERQVRIAAGALVLTGILLARFVHADFVWLSAFVGAGLVFAGLTDWCGMGMLLARMPWNQRTSPAVPAH